MANKRGIDIKTHFIELLVVIIGISIAFALEGWSSNRKERRLETNYLNSLKADLEKDKEDLQVLIDSTSVILKYVGEVFQYVYSNQPATVYRRHHMTSGYLTSYFYPKNGTYVSLINSGDISVVKSFELKAALSDLYNIEYMELARIDNVIRKLVDDTIQPYILDHIEFSITKDGIEDDAPLKNNKVINMLGSLFNLLSNRQIVFKEMIGKCDELIAQVEKAAQ